MRNNLVLFASYISLAQIVLSGPVGMFEEGPSARFSEHSSFHDVIPQPSIFDRPSSVFTGRAGGRRPIEASPMQEISESNWVLPSTDRRFSEPEEIPGTEPPGPSKPGRKYPTHQTRVPDPRHFERFAIRELTPAELQRGAVTNDPLGEHRFAIREPTAAELMRGGGQRARISDALPPVASVSDQGISPSQVISDPSVSDPMDEQRFAIREPTAEERRRQLM